MKSLGSIITIIFFVFIMLYGVVLIFNQAGTNVSLDLESINIISQYDTELQGFTNNITSNYNNSKGLIDYQTDSNDVGTEAKEFFETKDKVNQLKNTARMATKIPDLFFLSIPFVDEEDLSIYKIVAGIFLVIIIFVAFLAAIFGKFWGNT